MKQIYNIEMWQSLIEILDVSNFNLLESPYLCDNSDEFKAIFYDYDDEGYSNTLTSEAAEFLKNWKDSREWKISYKYLFGVGDATVMWDIPMEEKVPVRLAFCKYMLQKSLEYEGNQTEG